MKPVETLSSHLSRRRSRVRVPSLPVKYLQIGIFCCRHRRKRPPASFHPALIPHGNPRRKPGVAGNSRNLWRRPNQPEVFRRTKTEDPASRRRRRAKRRQHLPLGGRLLSQRELDGLVPRHRSSFVEGGVGSRLAEPGTGWVEVALAPCLGQRGGMGYAELLPLRVDGSLEAKGVFVSSEAGGGEGETEDLNGLLHQVSNCERGSEGAQPVLLGEGVVPPVDGVGGEGGIGGGHARDVFGRPR